MSNTLESQIANARLEIQADSISMSISELTSLYKEGILQIQPEFQRLFRWSAEQKSRLIESVLLGIPLPSLFVSQSESGGWELVDGLQRVSTLLQLQGLLKDAKDELIVPLKMTTTKFLPGLEGHSWNGVDGTRALTEAQKLDIRLARLDLRVIKRSSDPKAKFDLFQRLNSFGSILTAQDNRSAMIAGTNSATLVWLGGLAKLPAFRECISLSDRLLEEQYDLELVLRFLMLHDREPLVRTALTDFPTKLDDWSVTLAIEFDVVRAGLESTFFDTFTMLADAGGDDIFRKWNKKKQKFSGAFGNTSFEVIGLGLGWHISRGTVHRIDFASAARELWNNPQLEDRFATGLATADRFVKTIPLGRKLMAFPSLAITAEDLQ